MTQFTFDQHGFLISNNSAIPVPLYHGTTRPFLNHDADRHRSVLNQEYQGDWICYTDQEEVAWKYAHAARNQCIDRTLFLHELEGILRQAPSDPVMPDRILRIVTGILDEGYSQGWDRMEEFLPDYPDDNPHAAFMTDLHAFMTQKKLDINELCDLLEYVEGSKYGTSDDLTTQMVNLFNCTVPSFPQESVVEMRAMGFDQAVPIPRVVCSYIKGRSILHTDDRDTARQAKGEYDVVVYTGEGCVDGEAEFLIADPRQVLQKYHCIEETRITEDEMGYSQYEPERDVIAVKYLKIPSVDPSPTL